MVVGGNAAGKLMGCEYSLVNHHGALDALFALLSLMYSKPPSASSLAFVTSFSKRFLYDVSFDHCDISSNTSTVQSVNTFVLFLNVERFSGFLPSPLKLAYPL